MSVDELSLVHIARRVNAHRTIFLCYMHFMDEEKLKKEVAKRLRETRKMRGYDDVKAAAKYLGMKQSTYNQYENGTRLIPVEPLSVFAKKMKVSIDWILNGEGSLPHSSGTIWIPKISLVSAGNLTEIATIETLDDIPRIPVSDLPDGDWISFEVEGDSMDRISPPGSLIMVNMRDKALVPNACYVIANESGEATYKRYRDTPARFEPVSINPNHEPLFPVGPITIIGRVRRSVLPM